MQVPVLKHLDNGDTELHMLDLNDVIYICVENRTLVYHTVDQAYRHISTLSDWEDHLTEYGFDLTDKTNLVNISKIKKLDSKQGKLYFEEEPTSKSKFATIAFIKQKLFKNLILRAIANNKGTSLEYNLKGQGKGARLESENSLAD
ncbi:LytTR family transcriptional regulator [Xylanibacillus composti]|uniref:HTH LytTR-type domain-containing protein n=1 Tax=Xylanibacillus composti TaxID=1572762 RepID=A0A8J4H4C9_9BACL|nr:LytTR family DNA-binding domain-containing protein [Xylanibacillus composti]MDT9723745.1 LytTR family transcriptional regulator [Xylanibacillus composti]GIQ70787.1 hypothetical protein XYCOK13_36110 [Xylanibacillus composti]